MKPKEVQRLAAEAHKRASKKSKTQTVIQAKTPYAQKIKYEGKFKCAVCSGFFSDLACIGCGWIICQRCGMCSKSCKTKELRRAIVNYPAFAPSKAGFVNEEEWRRKKRDYMNGSTRRTDID